MSRLHTLRSHVGSVCVLLTVLWMCAPGYAQSNAAQPTPRSVLLLHTFDIGYANNAAFARAFRAELSKQSREPINFFDASLRPTPAAGAFQEEAVANYLRASVAGQRLDLVMTISAPAALFARRYREQLFPATPLLLAGVDKRWVQHEVLTAYETVVPVAIDPTRIVEDIVRLRPQTTNLIVVLGDSPFERLWVDELRREFQPLTDRLTLTWFNELSFAEMLKRSAALPDNSAILYLLLSVDAEGFTHSEERVLGELHEVANAPIFGAFSHQLGSGVVGGPVLSVDDVARDTASMAVRLLSGESAATITSTLLAAERPMYDWRELQRWGISEALLPAGSTVMFRQPGMWDQYQSYILGAVLIVGLQGALIAGLVVQRARRRRVELALRESEQRFRETAEQNQDLAGRLINAQEVERSRIARDLHDDLSQQLAGLGIMLSGLRRKIARAGTGPDIDQAVTMLQDRTSALALSVRNFSHELHPSVLQHAGLVATLHSHCADVERHHHVTVKFSGDDHLDSLSPEVSLCLFRVVQEALTNAVRHARARTIRVQLTATDEGVELSVIDDGIGFDASQRSGSGLGLRSIDERVRLARGHLTVESRPGRGTSLVVRLPMPQHRPSRRNGHSSRRRPGHAAVVRHEDATVVERDGRPAWTRRAHGDEVSIGRRTRAKPAVDRPPQHQSVLTDEPSDVGIHERTSTNGTVGGVLGHPCRAAIGRVFDREVAHAPHDAAVRVAAAKDDAGLFGMSRRPRSRAEARARAERAIGFRVRHVPSRASSSARDFGSDVGIGVFS